MIKKDDIINAMADAIEDVAWITTTRSGNTFLKNPKEVAEAALQALLRDLPDWHTLHADDKDKSILNTIGAIGTTYQRLVGMKDE